VIALFVVNGIAFLAVLLFILRHYRKKEPPPSPRFFLRTAEGLYLTPQGLRRAPMNRKGDVVAPAYDALSWETAAEAQAELKVYYEMNSNSHSTLSKVSLYVEKEGERE
jgi:hypothetical protein